MPDSDAGSETEVAQSRDDTIHPEQVELGDRVLLATRDDSNEELTQCDGSAVEVVETYRDTVEVLRIVDPNADQMKRRVIPPCYSLLYSQIKPLPDDEPLAEAGPYEDDELPYMNFECPECGFSLCEWTDCPECGWYDEDVWLATMAWYVDCVGCGQTIPTAEVHLCDDCRDDYHVVGQPDEARHVIVDEYDLGRDA